MHHTHYYPTTRRHHQWFHQWQARHFSNASHSLSEDQPRSPMLCSGETRYDAVMQRLVVATVTKSSRSLLGLLSRCLHLKEGLVRRISTPTSISRALKAISSAASVLNKWRTRTQHRSSNDKCYEALSLFCFGNGTTRAWNFRSLLEVRKLRVGCTGCHIRSATTCWSLCTCTTGLCRLCITATSSCIPFLHTYSIT